MKVSLLGSKWRDYIKGKATVASEDLKKVLHNMYTPSRRSRKISKKERLRMILRELYMLRRKGVVKLIVLDRYTRYSYGLPPLVRQPLLHLEKTNKRGKGFSSNDAGDGPEEIELSDGSVDERTEVTGLRAELRSWAKSRSVGVREAMGRFEMGEVVSKRFGVGLTKYTLLELAPGCWLSGKTINFYMQLLQSRENKHHNITGEKISKFMSIDLFEVLLAETYSHAQAQKHTKGLKIWETRNIFCPINVNGNHWMLLVIDVERTTMHFYDSLASDIWRYFRAAERWLADELTQGGGLDGWTFGSMQSPKQENGFDCGVFMLANANALGSGQLLNHTQADCTRLRDEIAKEIVLGKCRELRQSSRRLESELTALEREAIDYLTLMLEDETETLDEISATGSEEIEGGLSSDDEWVTPFMMDEGAVRLNDNCTSLMAMLGEPDVVKRSKCDGGVRVKQATANEAVGNNGEKLKRVQCILERWDQIQSPKARKAAAEKDWKCLARELASEAFSDQECHVIKVLSYRDQRRKNKPLPKGKAALDRLLEMEKFSYSISGYGNAEHEQLAMSCWDDCDKTEEAVGQVKFVGL
jgi:sentrin-specific protease 1